MKRREAKGARSRLNGRKERSKSRGYYAAQNTDMFWVQNKVDAKWNK